MSLTHAIEDKDSESRALAPQIERVNRLAQERAELDLRLGIINKLQKGRTLSVRVMDELARCVPDHLWMTLAQQDAGSQLDLEGVTYSNLVVSDFMSRLERSPIASPIGSATGARAMSIPSSRSSSILRSPGSTRSPSASSSRSRSSALYSRSYSNLRSRHHG